MSLLKAVLFDLDGTLLDSAPDIRQALNQMLTDEGRAPLPLSTVTTMIGDGAMELCHRALEATGGMEGTDVYPYVQKFIAAYRSLPPDPAQIFPGVRETLAALRQANVKLGVCTNKQETSTKKILDALGLSAFFGFIAGGDTFEVHKPHPGHILGALEKLGIAGTDGVVFVGDGPNDVLASQRANVPCVVVTHGYGQDYGSLAANVKIPNLDALLPRLAEMGLEVRG